MFSITRVGHVEIRVTDLDKAWRFYVDMLGLVETERDGGRIYLRGYEERQHHSLVLKLADSPGLAHFAYRVADPEDLDRLADFFKARNLPVVKIPQGHEKGQGEAIRVQDPLGFPVEFYHEMEEVERLLQQFHLYRGAAPMRLDHVNCQTPNVQAGYDYYVKELGFWVSEYTETDDGKLWAAWLHRKQNVHDIALMTGTGPRLHHFAYWVQDLYSVIKVCDILAGANMVKNIERGPGRHGLSNAFFVYVRDPDGNRMEIYTSDYMIADPDWKPIKWSLNDPRRQTFWGHAAPRSWFDEASLVESVVDGKLLTPTPAELKDRPDFVT